MHTLWSNQEVLHLVLDELDDSARSLIALACTAKSFTGPALWHAWQVLNDRKLVALHRIPLSYQSYSAGTHSPASYYHALPRRITLDLTDADNTDLMQSTIRGILDRPKPQLLQLYSICIMLNKPTHIAILRDLVVIHTHQLTRLVLDFSDQTYPDADICALFIDCLPLGSRLYSLGMTGLPLLSAQASSVLGSILSCANQLKWLSLATPKLSSPIFRGLLSCHQLQQLYLIASVQISLPANMPRVWGLWSLTNLSLETTLGVATAILQGLSTSIHTLRLTVKVYANDQQHLKPAVQTISHRFPLLQHVYLAIRPRPHDEARILYWDDFTPLLQCRLILTLDLCLYSVGAIYLQHSHLRAISQSWPNLRTFYCRSRHPSLPLSTVGDLNIRRSYHISLQGLLQFSTSLPQLRTVHLSHLIIDSPTAELALGSPLDKLIIDRVTLPDVAVAAFILSFSFPAKILQVTAGGEEADRWNAVCHDISFELSASVSCPILPKVCNHAALLAVKLRTGQT
ncbi:hypothetical protein CALCODRAFT_533805 [Calocera cornea HHB12733]|uniref:F-box domain-containing protein n=1 Tax=Calocera cornea HHB12733 TaxID=1353952 RepID=A0A165K5I2_9BASI|nr:hypothetical protein CALCODRAFT_533805 [Calocera cornea HHB12733]